MPTTSSSHRRGQSRFGTSWWSRGSRQSGSLLPRDLAAPDRWRPTTHGPIGRRTGGSISSSSRPAVSLKSPTGHARWGFLLYALGYAASRLVALDTSRARRMEKQERVLFQVFDRHSHDVPRACEPRMSVSDPSFGLEAPFPEPPVYQTETGATMVVLSIVDPNRAPSLKDSAVLRHAVRNAGHEFRQVEYGVGVVTDSEEEYLPVQLVHPTDGTLG